VYSRLLTERRHPLKNVVSVLFRDKLIHNNEFIVAGLQQVSRDRVSPSTSIVKARVSVRSFKEVNSQPSADHINGLQRGCGKPKSIILVPGA